MTETSLGRSEGTHASSLRPGRPAYMQVKRNIVENAMRAAPVEAGNDVAHLIEVVIGDDHAVFLDALATVLADQGCAVTKATTISDTVCAVRKRQPDVCLVDRHFAAGADGLGALGEISGASPRTKVLILSADGNSDSIMRAMRAGAAAYVHKTRGVAVLKQTIERVLRGEIVIEVRPRRASGPS